MPKLIFFPQIKLSFLRVQSCMNTKTLHRIKIPWICEKGQTPTECNRANKYDKKHSCATMSRKIKTTFIFSLEILYILIPRISSHIQSDNKMEFQHITRMLFFPLMPTHKHFNAFDVRQNYLYILVFFLVYKWKFIKIIYVYGTAYDCFACRLICDLYTITLWYGNIFYLYVFFLHSYWDFVFFLPTLTRRKHSIILQKFFCINMK